MRFMSRLKRLEQKAAPNAQLWAIFTIGHYDNLIDQGEAQQRLVNEYVAQGNIAPTHRIFVKEVPATLSNVHETFVTAFLR